MSERSNLTPEPQTIPEPETVQEDFPAGAQDPTPALSRRKLLVASAGAAAAAAFSPLGVGRALAQEGMDDGHMDGFMEEPEKAMGPMDVDFAAHGEDFEHPPTVVSRAREMVQNLFVQQANMMIHQIDDTMRVELTRTYNGMVPGPTFLVDPGDKLSFVLYNQLPPNPDQRDCERLMMENKPNCFNSTNLHTHGLHVSPSSKYQNGKPVLASDDVLITVPPLERLPYCIWLPDFHAPGTHWYHSHRHGSTAIQVINGMVGAIIVQEPPDQRIQVDSEMIWIMQEIVGTQNDADSKIYTCEPPQVRFTVNGVDTPRFKMLPNEIRRWRFVNATASPRGFCNLFLRKQGSTDMVPISLIALDGITFYGWQPQPVPGPGRTGGLTFSPGNRADFLVKLPAGTYEMVKGQSDLGVAGEQVLAVVDVSGPTLPDRPLPSLPGREFRPCYLKPIPDAEPINRNNPRAITFSVNNGNCGDDPPGSPIKANFLINGVKFGDPAAVQTVQLGSTELWTLANASRAAHPFHIHVNPFQIKGNLIDYTKPDSPENRAWWDTIPVPKQTTGGASLQMLTRFLDYGGDFVFHCHILIHEDLGMMQEVKVEGKGVGPCEPLAKPLKPC